MTSPLGTCLLDCFEWEERGGDAVNILKMAAVGDGAGVTGEKGD